MGTMTGLSRINFEAFAAKFDCSKFRTLCDIGGSTGLLCIETAKGACLKIRPTSVTSG